MSIDLAAWEPEFTNNPYGHLGKLREDKPVAQIVLYGLPAWLVTRHDDIKVALSDPRLSSNLAFANEATRAVPWVGAIATGGLDRQVARVDPPDHTRLRNLISQALTPRRVEAMRPRIQEITDGLLAGFLARGEADLMREFAQPLPLTVICDLLGIGLEEQDQFARWVDIFTGTDEGDLARVPTVMGAIYDYLVDLVDRKRAELVGDPQDGCLLDGLIAARDGSDQLSSSELLAMAFVLLVAGYETTANLIGNGMLALFGHPEQFAALRADPALLGSAIEEFLRYDPPLKLTPGLRVAMEDVRIGDTVIPAGDTVMFALAAANRDPSKYVDPDRFDITRRSTGHVAFGHGIHYCVGATLARVEAEIAFTSLFRACPDLVLAEEGADWRPSPLNRGLRRLPVRFTPGTLRK